MVEYKRKLILFFHIPKCGGQSVAAMVDQAMRRGRNADMKAVVWDGVQNELAFCEEALDCEFVSGHLSLDMVDYIRARVPTYVFTVLREPAERTASEIRYLVDCGRAAGMEGACLEDIAQMIAASDFEDWIASVANPITRMLSGSSAAWLFRGGDGRAFTARALRNLRSFDAFGSLDKLDALISKVLSDNGILVPHVQQRFNPSSQPAATREAGIVRSHLPDCVHMDTLVWREAVGPKSSLVAPFWRRFTAAHSR